MAESSLRRERKKLGDNSEENISDPKVSIFSSSSVKQKENREKKNVEIPGNIVNRLRIRYEEKNISRNNIIAVDEKKMGTESGAIKKTVLNKKRVAFTENSNTGTNISHGLKNDNNMPDPKRPKISSVDDTAFSKTRFNVYTDQQSLERVAEDALKSTVKRPLNKLIPQLNFDRKFTPCEGLPIEPKKVKVQHRKGSMPVDEKIHNNAQSMCPESDIELMYDDQFVELELNREKPFLRNSRGFRDRNITVNQRKIIIKFLTRVHAHSFYPSYFLYQTVRLFDAVLESRMVPVEELQLVALAAMWIVLKKEQIPYKVPSATGMISLAKDLYEGQVNMFRKCEREILQSLNFEIVFPDPFTIMYYYMITCHRSYLLESADIHNAYYCGCYMIDLSLVDDNLMKISTALLAAAASETALGFVMEKRTNPSKPEWIKWRSLDATIRFHEDEISEVRSTLMRRIAESRHRYTDGEIIFKKYSRSRYGRISKFICCKVDSFLDSDQLEIEL